MRPMYGGCVLSPHFLLTWTNNILKVCNRVHKIKHFGLSTLPDPLNVSKPLPLPHPAQPPYTPRPTHARTQTALLSLRSSRLGAVPNLWARKGVTDFFHHYLVMLCQVGPLCQFLSRQSAYFWTIRICFANVVLIHKWNENGLLVKALIFKSHLASQGSRPKLKKRVATLVRCRCFIIVSAVIIWSCEPIVSVPCSILLSKIKPFMLDLTRTATQPTETV